jgi:hypothetical protein
MYKAMKVGKTTRSKDTRTLTFVTHMFLTSEHKTVLSKRLTCLQDFSDLLIPGIQLGLHLLKPSLSIFSKKLHVISVARADGSETFDFFFEFELAL